MQLLTWQPSQKIFLDMAREKHRKEDGAARMRLKNKIKIQWFQSYGFQDTP